MENKRTETNKTVQKRLEPELKLINMDTVEVEQIEWLLYPFIPPSLGFSTMIFGGNQKFISSQTSIFAGFFYVQKNLTKKILPVYIYSAIVL